MEKRTIVTTLTVDNPKEAKVVLAALAALRSGFSAPELHRDKTYVSDYVGPYAVDDATDLAIINAIMEHAAGWDTDPMLGDDTGKQIRDGCPRVAEAVATGAGAEAAG